MDILVISPPGVVVIVCGCGYGYLIAHKGI